MMADTPSENPRGRPRVLVMASHYYPDAMEWHIIEALRHMGCPVQAFELGGLFNSVPPPLKDALIKTTSLLLREPERLAERRLIRAVIDFAPALILVTLGNQVSPKTIELLRAATKSPIVCWCQDQMTTLGRQYLLGAGYDAVFVKDRYMQDIFSRMIRSTMFFYLPEACNPRVHRRVELNELARKEFECDLMIAGTFYYYRQEIVRQLGEFNVKLWGSVPDWMLNRMPDRHAGRAVYTDDKARAVAGARICLNTLHYGEVNALNCRAFELAGCAGFQMITEVPVLAEHFVPDQELVTFKTVEELVEKTRYYLAHSDQAAEIARRGQLRAYQEHTYEHRLEEILRLSLG